MGSPSLHRDIIRGLRFSMEAEGLDTLVIMGNENILYAAGANMTTALRAFTPISALIVTGDGSILVLPGDEYTRVMEEAPRGVFEAKTYNPLETSLPEHLPEILLKLGSRRIGVDSAYTPHSVVKELEARTGAEIHDATSLILAERMVKREEEIRCMEKAADILVRSIEKALEYLKPGMSEREIAAEIEYWSRRMGASYTPMINLVASGERLIHPHPHSTDRRIRPGDLVMLDVATTYAYYSSDMTRFASIGPLRQEDREKFEFIEEVIGTLIDAAVEGNTVRDMWVKVVEEYRRHGYSEHLNHVVGRGIGIELVEPPIIDARAGDTELRRNMTLAFNPSLHIVGQGGWRLEDVVVVGARRARILTRMPWRVVEKKG